jgi:hypothetical protein
MSRVDSIMDYLHLVTGVSELTMQIRGGSGAAYNGMGHDR